MLLQDLDIFIVFLNILSKNIFLAIIDFKISDPNKEEKSLLHNGNIYGIDALLKSRDMSWRCTARKCWLMEELSWLNLAIITLVMILKFNHSTGIPEKYM